MSHSKKPSLKELATQARLHSYSPYSHKKVGAALLLSNGMTYSGCNVENSSFGGTVCAERTAILKAVSEEKTLPKIVEVVVVTDATPPWTPCGLCRQVINEFADSNCKITLANLSGAETVYSFKELFPHGFDASSLVP